MPPKATRSNAAHKQEVAGKVKEIKQRQQNWFKQREQSLKNKGPSPSSNGSPSGSGRFENDDDPFLPTQHPKRNPNQPINRQTVTVKHAAHRTASPASHRADKQAGFRAWRETQQFKGSEDTEDDDQRSEYAETTSTDIPLYSDVESCRSDIPSRVGTSHMEQLSGTLSPDQFDALADQIITRVKKELHVPVNKSSVRQDYGDSPSHQSHYSGGSESNHQQGNSGLDSHYCSKCSSLMLPPTCQPMLVIPCAHSICVKCVERRSQCPVCNCDISSVTCNIMLQQIIVDYKAKHPEAHTKGQGSYTAARYSKPARDYDDEYKTLCIRCEVLQTEEESINDRINEIRQQVKREEKQIDNISKEERKIQDSIIELQRKLHSLGAHKVDFVEKCKTLQSKEDDERQKLTLCNETLQQLKQEASKIKRFIPD